MWDRTGAFVGSSRPGGAGALPRLSEELDAAGLTEAGSPGRLVEPVAKPTPAGTSTDAQCLLPLPRSIILGGRFAPGFSHELLELSSDGLESAREVSDVNVGVRGNASACPLAVLGDVALFAATDGAGHRQLRVAARDGSGMLRADWPVALPPSGPVEGGRVAATNEPRDAVVADLHDGGGPRALFVADGSVGPSSAWSGRLAMFELPRGIRAPPQPPLLADELDRVAPANASSSEWHEHAHAVRAVCNGRWVLFAASDGSGLAGDELWAMGVPPGATVGPGLALAGRGRPPAFQSSASPWQHADIVAGPTGSSPRDFVDFDGIVVFTAWTPEHGRELFGMRVDDGESGDALGAPKLLVDAIPGAIGSDPRDLVALNGETLAFTAWSAAHGREVMVLHAWGAAPPKPASALVLPPVPPALLADLVAGPPSSDPESLTVIGGRLYFSARTPATGRELFVAEPAAPARLLWEGIAGPKGSSPRSFVAFRQRLFFVADDPEFWGSGEVFSVPLPAPLPPDDCSRLAGRVSIGLHMCALRVAGAEISAAGAQLGASVAVASGPAGGAVAAGAPGSLGGRGSVVVMHRDVTSPLGWKKAAELAAPQRCAPGTGPICADAAMAGAAAADPSQHSLGLGTSLSASSGFIVAGGPSRNSSAGSLPPLGTPQTRGEGAVVLWRWTAQRGRWELVASMTGAAALGAAGKPGAVAEGMQFGRSVAISSDWLFVGAPGMDGGVGGVFVFRRSSLGRWSLAQLLEPSSPVTGASPAPRFGWAVALDGDAGAVGAPGAPQGTVTAAFLNQLDVWEVARDGVLQAGDYGVNGSRRYSDAKSMEQLAAGSPDWFGFSVATAGRRILVGAPGASDPASSVASGAAYTFTSRVAGRFDEDVLTGKLSLGRGAAGDMVGMAVALALPGARPGTAGPLGSLPSFLEDDGAQALVSGQAGRANSNGSVTVGGEAGDSEEWRRLQFNVNSSASWNDAGVAVFEADLPSSDASQIEQRFLQVQWLRPHRASSAFDGLGRSIAADSLAGLVVLGAPFDDGEFVPHEASETFGAGAAGRGRRDAGAFYIAECSAAAVQRASAVLQAEERGALAQADAPQWAAPWLALSGASGGSTAASRDSGWLVPSFGAGAGELRGAATLASLAAPGAHVGVCRPGAFLRSPCTAARPARCAACSSGPCPAGSFEAAPCGPAGDRRCQACSACPPGEFAARACQPASDTVCAPCPVDGCPPPSFASQPDERPDLPPVCQRLGLGQGGCSAPIERLTPPLPLGATAGEAQMLRRASFFSELLPGVPGAASAQAARDTHLIREYGHRDSPASERARAALVDLYEATGGQYWTNPWPPGERGGLLGEPCSEPWEGVHCDTAGRVHAIRLSGRRLLGSVPESLCRALGGHLRVLDLSHNELVGSLPESLPLCRRLELVDFSHNSLGQGAVAALVQAVQSMPKLRSAHALQASATDSEGDLAALRAAVGSPSRLDSAGR